MQGWRWWLGFLLLAALVGKLWGVEKIGFMVADEMDDRPAVNILFLGNSRTFFHDMPQMVRELADSAGSENRYRIVVHAPGGRTLQNHWESPAVQELLEQKWDYVVIQGQSGEQLWQQGIDSFMKYGHLLIDKAKAGGATPVLFVTWRYADGSPTYARMHLMPQDMHERIQKYNIQLAGETGARLVNVGTVWETLQAVNPDAGLYNPGDDNHPSLRGSYLSALMFYRFFSHCSLKAVQYVPDGLSQEDADWLKSVVEPPAAALN